MRLVDPDETSSDGTTRTESGERETLATARAFFEAAGPTLAEDYRKALAAILETAENANRLVTDEGDGVEDCEPVTLVLVSRERLDPWVERMLDQPASATDCGCARVDEDVLRDYGF